MTRYICPVFLVLLSLGFDVAFGGGDNVWTYAGNQGPSHWPDAFPDCAGKSQSPIDIVTSRLRVNTNLSLVHLQGYDEVNRVSMEMINNGHTAQVNLHGDYYISGGGLPGTYQAAQLHFHWGDVDQRGSEHLRNGEHFPMEMHIVHYSTKFPNSTAALHQQDGLAVLGFFFEVSDTDNNAFYEILTNFESIEHRDEKVSLHTFSIRSMMPGDMSIFYRYHGSLTTPPCSETVIWTLFQATIPVSEHQLNRFRRVLKSNLNGTSEVDLVDVFRPPQALNTRVVLTNSKLGLASTGSLPVLAPTRLKIILYLSFLHLVTRLN